MSQTVTINNELLRINLQKNSIEYSTNGGDRTWRFRRLKKLVLSLAVMLMAVVNVMAQNYIKQGESSYGTVLYNWDGTNLRIGSSRYDGTVSKSVSEPSGHQLKILQI